MVDIWKYQIDSDSFLLSTKIVLGEKIYVFYNFVFIFVLFCFYSVL